MLRARHDATNSRAVASALRAISVEQLGLSALADALAATDEGGLGQAFARAVETISRAPGRVIVTGMGKSGHVARKIAATLASTGQPASFVHAAEASHGDLGMVQNGDVVVAVSWSGETAELAAIVTYAKRFAIPADRDHRQRRQRARPRGRRPPVPAQGPGSLPERPRADHLDDDAARARRRAGDRAAGGQGLHRARFPACSIPAASSAPSSPSCATSCTAASASRAFASGRGWRTPSSRCRRRASAASASSTVRRRSSASSPTATCAGT